MSPHAFSLTIRAAGFLDQAAAAEKPVDAMLDRQERKYVKRYDEHNYELNIGAKRIGQRLLEVPYSQQNEGTRNPEDKNGAPANGSLHLFHGKILYSIAFCLLFPHSERYPGICRFLGALPDKVRNLVVQSLRFAQVPDRFLLRTPVR
jgi:hypothetical protein